MKPSQNQTRKAQAERDKKKKEKQNNLTEKYYKHIPADFRYLEQYGYLVYKELGRGGYGVVYKAYKIKNGNVDKSSKSAIKINFLTVTPELIYSEIAFLNLLKSKKNMPQMADLFIYNDKIHIVLEYFKYKPFISFFADFNMKDIKYYLYELLTSIKTLTDMGIYHRDIKPGNFLYNPAIKKGILIDFGLSEVDPNFLNEQLKKEKAARLAGNQDLCAELVKTNELYQNISKCERIVGTNKIGTESFMPLESIMRTSTQSYAVDMWPVGVIFLQFLLKKYNIFNNVRMINKPANLKNNFFITFILELSNIFGTDQVGSLCQDYGYQLTFPSDLPKQQVNYKQIIKMKGFDDSADDLLKKLLALDHKKRISVNDAINHPFFNDIKNTTNNSNTQNNNNNNNA